MGDIPPNLKYRILRKREIYGYLAVQAKCPEMVGGEVINAHDFPQAWNNLRKSYLSRGEGRAEHQLNLADQ